ncbi:carbohydrate sulfotransferase 12-like [Lytechinus variegatus]|uniref:carbohydrate sulfotransferase 12-like n=1 Tax=Lytechinus variegatus TaxID=7654 RepID=UPI001BB13E68|nr:carbohydrate sulfotransferase 12-like [Lytechinus variegatus]
MGTRNNSLLITIIGLMIFLTVIFIHTTSHDVTVWLELYRGSVGHGQDQMANQVEDVQHIQEQRKEHLKKGCAALGYSQRFVNKNLDRATLRKFSRVHVIPELKVVYCPIPKVASTSWLRLLLTAVNEDSSQPHKKSKRVFPNLASFPPWEARRILRTYTTFFFVRNPYARILSAYKNKILSEGESKFRHEVLKWYKLHDPNELKRMNSSKYFTFKQFVNYYTKSTVKNVHWEDMIELCHPCMIHYDFIGHLETLKEDSGYLMNLLNIGMPFPEEQRHHQTNSSQGDTLQTFYSQLAGGEYKDLSFSQGLARDALLFGYDTPESIKRS